MNVIITTYFVVCTELSWARVYNYLGSEYNYYDKLCGLYWTILGS